MYTYMIKAVRCELAAAAALTALKVAAALWCGSVVLLAQAAYSAGGLLTVLAVMPGGGWAVSYGPGSHSRADRIHLLAVLSTVLPVLALSDFVLRQAVIGLIAGTPEINTAVLLGIVLSFAAAEAILWHRFAAIGRRSRSLAIAALSGQLRSGFYLLLFVPVTILAEQLGCYFAENLAAAGLSVLILRLLLEMLYSLPGITENAALPEFLLRAVRRRVLTVKGVLAAGKIRGRLERDKLVLRLELISVEGLNLAEQDSLREAARQAVLNSYSEVSQVFCAAATLPRRRALLLRQ
ncbi:MAG: cation transporter [Bacillota bacterium]